MLKLLIIVASTRPNRAADLVMPWLESRVNAEREFDAEVVDLRDWPLPIFAEDLETIGDFSDPNYSAPIVKAWNDKLSEGDAFIIVTPEYHHSIPGALKNAFDTVMISPAFRNKPIAAVGYSAGVGGGSRAVEHLVQIASGVEAAFVRNAVTIPSVAQAFDGAGQPTDRLTSISLDVMLEDLSWWATALQQARTAGELLPGVLRVRAAFAGAQS
jgi:NAD(P)H-dependent FMN reductase